MSQNHTKSKPKTTLLGILCGLGFGGIWIGLSIYLQQSPSEKPGPETSTSSRANSARIATTVRSEIEPFQVGSRKSSRILANELRELTEDLNPTEIQVLLDWLRHPETAMSMAPQEEAFLFNEVMSLFYSQENPVEGLSEVVTEIYQEQNRSSLIRNYALQHMRLVWERAGDDGDDRKLVEAALWKASEGADPGMSGTALMTLHNLGFKEGLVETGSRKIADSDFDAVITKLLLSSPGSAPLMSALRISSERGLTSHTPQIRHLVEQDKANTAVRLKAISALGHLGDEEDLLLLRGLQTKPVFQAAVSKAIQNLSNDPS